MIRFATLRRLAPAFALAALSAASVAPSAAAQGPETADRLSYAFFSAGERHTMMSGSSADLAAAQRLRRGQEAMLFIRYRGTGYVIRDDATLREIEAILEPQRRLGAEQGALGARQGALGGRQAQLGMRQARLATHRGGPADDQRALGREQRALSAQQQVLSQEQGVLSRRQREVSRVADARLRTLADNAIRRGIAQRID